VTSLTAPTWDFRGSSDSKRRIVRTHRPQFAPKLAPKKSYLDNTFSGSSDARCREVVSNRALAENDHSRLLLTALPPRTNFRSGARRRLRRATHCGDLRRRRGAGMGPGHQNTGHLAAFAPRPGTSPSTQSHVAASDICRVRVGSAAGVGGIRLGSAAPQYSGTALLVPDGCHLRDRPRDHRVCTRASPPHPDTQRASEGERRIHVLSWLALLARSDTAKDIERTTAAAA
jgi:hypothetical protein